MRKEFFILLAAIFGALGAMYFWLGSDTIYRENGLAASKPHLYQNPKVSIEEIRISMFYFVPKNKAGNIFADWHAALMENLEKLQKFHDLEFQGRSKITFDIYPEPVIGLKDNLDYDTSDTNRGNPHALLNVARELEARGLIPTKKDIAYHVLGIFYEGVGAAGADGFFLLGRSFLADPMRVSHGATILAHEFYHTLGLEDAYEQSAEAAYPFSQDLMGSGRSGPLENTYLSRETLKSLGL